MQRKKWDFVWTSKCEHAFSSLKKALTTPPTPILDMNASDVEMGAVLNQAGPAGKRVVTYFCKTFNKTECCYCMTFRVPLAVVKAIGHFIYYPSRSRQTTLCSG